MAPAHDATAPAPIEADGRYFDGVSARPHPVTLRLDDRLRILGGDIARDWDLRDLRAAASAPPILQVGPADGADRVSFSDAAFASALAARCPDLHRRVETGGLLRLVAWSLAAGLSVLLVAVFGVPRIADRLAPLVPDAAEARLGAVAEPQILRLLGSPPACSDPDGLRTVQDLVARLVAAAGPAGPLPMDLRVDVRRHRVANAFALPGDRVIVLSRLIAQARSADEVAGVLAHELGHVRRRDPTRALIRASGTSFLLSLVLGDLTGSTLLIALSEALLSAGYSRDAERAADAYAVDLITRAGGNGAALADILERIARDTDGDRSAALDLLRSHPFTGERAAAIRERAGPDAPGRAILSEREWAALRGLCGPNAATRGP